jgi:NAD(P)-dependent dehydrogenase (short-subunit alcohol dehydrogenase family)
MYLNFVISLTYPLVVTQLILLSFGVVINSMKVEEAQAVSKEVKNLHKGCDSVAIGADISKEDDCIKLVADTVKHYGRIDVLVNNARI